jgi:polar amino acid transport system substrate-binding protein
MLRSYYDILTPYLPLLAKGLGATVLITLLSLVAGTVLGAGIYALTKSNRTWVRKTAQCYRFLVRGTPIMVFLLLFYYIVLQGSWGIAAAVLAFSFNFSNFACSVIQSSFDTVGKGQIDAGISLGFSRYQILRYIIAPQALVNALPAYKFQATTLLKGTSVVGYVSILDLTQVTEAIRHDTGESLLALVLVTAIYMILAWLLCKLLDHCVKTTHKI